MATDRIDALDAATVPPSPPENCGGAAAVHVDPLSVEWRMAFWLEPAAPCPSQSRITDVSVRGLTVSGYEVGAAGVRFFGPGGVVGGAPQRAGVRGARAGGVRRGDEIAGVAVESQRRWARDARGQGDGVVGGEVVAGGGARFEGGRAAAGTGGACGGNHRLDGASGHLERLHPGAGAQIESSPGRSAVVGGPQVGSEDPPVSGVGETDLRDSDAAGLGGVGQ